MLQIHVPVLCVSYTPMKRPSIEMHPRILKRSRIKHKEAKKKKKSHHNVTTKLNTIMQTKHDSRSQSTAITNELTQQHPAAAEFKMGK